MMRRREMIGRTVAAGLAAGVGHFGLGFAQAKGPSLARLPKSILMLGGTGFLGPHTVRAALKRGHKVTLFNNDKRNPKLFPDLENLLGDRRTSDYAAIEGRSWDAVIDTSANVPRWVNEAAAILGPRVGHYVYISSVSVYRDMSQPGIDESGAVSELGPDQDPATETITGETYGPLKALTEKAAERAMPGKVTVVRPGLIVGPGDPTDRFTYWPVRVARGGEVLAPGAPGDPVQFVDVRDLGEFLITLIEKQSLGTFNALGPRPPLSMGQMLEACKKSAGSDAQFTWVPPAFLEAQEIQPWSHMPAWVPNEGETAGFMHVNNDRAVAAGLTFRPIEETAKATLDWFRSLPEDRQKKLGAGISPEREKAVLAAWNAQK